MLVSPPTLTGVSTSVGQSLRTTTGSWEGTAWVSWIGFERCVAADGGARCYQVSGGSAVDYVLRPADDGYRIRSCVTVANDSGQETACSALTTAIHDGRPAAGPSFDPVISSNGRYVAFTSDAANLSLLPDTNVASDIILKDRLTEVSSRVSISTSGTQANASSSSPAISNSGRYVAYESRASNLVSDDTNGVTDVYLTDTVEGATVRASVSDAGGQISAGGVTAAISGDGRYVAFVTGSSQVMPGDTNGLRDVYVFDRLAGRTVRRISVPSAGGEADGASGSPDMSVDGRYVAFTSQATNLDPPPAPAPYTPDDVSGRDTQAPSTRLVALAIGTGEVFVRDTQAPSTRLVSLGLAGSGTGFARKPRISDDGRYVAYIGREGPADWIMVRDRVGGTTRYLAKPSIDSSVAITGDGRYVLFDDRNEYQSANQIYEASVDAFYGPLGISRNDRFGGGRFGNGDSSAPSASGDGRYAAFTTLASDLIPGDTDANSDVVAHTWADSIPPGGLSGYGGSLEAGAAGAPGLRARASHCGGRRRAAPQRRGRHRERHRLDGVSDRGVRRERVERPSRRTQARAACWIQGVSRGAGGAAALTAAVAAIAYALEKEENSEVKLRGCGVPLYHYTDPLSARNIYVTRMIDARGPPLVYATTIPPTERSQSDLRAHLGVPDVSAWVLFCSNRSRTWYPVGPPAPVDFWRAPAPAPVSAVAWALNPRS